MDNDFKEIYYGDICFQLVFQYFQTVTTVLKTQEKVVNSEVRRVLHLMDQWVNQSNHEQVLIA